MNYYPNNNTFNHKSSATPASTSLFDSYLSSLQQQQQQQQQFQNDYYSQTAIPRSRQNSTTYPIGEPSFPISHTQRVYYPQITTAPGTRRVSSQYNTYLPATPNRTQIIFNDQHKVPERASFVNINNSEQRRLSSRQFDILQTQKNFNFVFNETIAGDNMDSVIDTMAKRRIALKRLEQEQSKINKNEPQYMFNENIPYTPQSRLNDISTIIPQNVLNGVNSEGKFETPTQSLSTLPLTSQPTIIHHHHYYGGNRSVDGLFNDNQIYSYQESGSRPISKQINVQPLRPPTINKNLSKSVSLETENGRLSITRERLKTPNDDTSILHTASFFNNKFNNLYDKRNLFWSSGTIIRFYMRIKKEALRKRLTQRPKSSSTLIFRIRLLEIMTALHRVYLEPAGPIYLALIQVIKSTNDLSTLLFIDDKQSTHHELCINTLNQYIDNIITKITEFMPKEGILGTNHNSALISLLMPGNQYPDNYFWQCEKEFLEFDENYKINRITNEQSIIIFIGNVFARGLITTLLVKPIKFRLVRGELTELQKLNIKIVSTILYYIVRLASSSTRFMKFPLEWQDSFYNDTKMNRIYTNKSIKKTIDDSKIQLLKWSKEYIRRLKEAPI